MFLPWLCLADTTVTLDGEMVELYVVDVPGQVPVRDVAPARVSHGRASGGVLECPERSGRARQVVP